MRWDRRSLENCLRLCIIRSRSSGTDILAGNIDAAPYRLDKKEACAFCPYHGVCGFDEKMPGFSYRNLKKFDSDEEIFAQMRKEEFHGHDVDGEPEKVIDRRERNILVSAAGRIRKNGGSGRTYHTKDHAG